MKKIKRTITMRKIEITANKSHIRNSDLSVCPLCRSPIHAVKSAVNSAVEHTAAESSIKLIEKTADESDEAVKD